MFLVVKLCGTRIVDNAVKVKLISFCFYYAKLLNFNFDRLVIGDPQIIRIPVIN